MSDVNVVFEPNPGSQCAILDCPTFETLLSGPRGTGKTLILLIDFLQDVGKGHPRWRGLITRKHHGDLRGLILESQQLFHGLGLAPKAKLVQSPERYWEFPCGARLEFRQLFDMQDYWKIHGNNFDWWFPDEITTMADPEPYFKTFSLVRGPDDGTPRRVRPATNPSGPGHNWVADRFRMHGWPRGRIVGPEFIERDEDGEPMPPRRAICGSIPENPHLDKSYIQSLRASCTSPGQLRAWLYGDWDITEGGMFDDLWDPSVHVVPNLALEEIPQGWRLSRSYDWGAASPFSLGWTWESDGEPIVKNGKLIGDVRGDKIRWREWYGAAGKLGTNKGLKMVDRDIAREVLRREQEWGVEDRVVPGYADEAIFQKNNGMGVSIADVWAQEGIRWLPCTKGPNSRPQGWQQVRQWLAQAVPNAPVIDPELGEIPQPREEPGYVVCSGCEATLKFLPKAPRDEKKPDDVDTDSEDHVLDEIRYGLYQKARTMDRNTLRRSRRGPAWQSANTWRR